MSNIDKAHLMAETEDPARELAAEFKSYIKDPIAYGEREQASGNAAKREAEGTPSQTHEFAAMYSSGLRPEDIVETGIQEAEAEGSLFDYREKLKKRNPLMLRMTRKLIERRLERAEKNYEISINYIPPDHQALVSERGNLVADTFVRIGAEEDDMIEMHNHLYKKVVTLRTKKELVDDELENRGIIE